MSASVPDRIRETVFAIASMRTCVAMVTSDGIPVIAVETGGRDSVIVPMFDCTISVYVGYVSAIVLETKTYSHSQP